MSQRRNPGDDPGENLENESMGRELGETLENESLEQPFREEEHDQDHGESESYGVDENELDSFLRRHRDDGDRRADRELVVIDDDRYLSAAQRKAVLQLNELYRSLCGGQPGQYWPASLLDAGGGFSRPAFPVRGRQ